MGPRLEPFRNRSVAKTVREKADLVTTALAVSSDLMTGHVETKRDREPTGRAPIPIRLSPIHRVIPRECRDRVRRFCMSDFSKIVWALLPVPL